MSDLKNKIRESWKTIQQKRSTASPSSRAQPFFEKRRLDLEKPLETFHEPLQKPDLPKPLQKPDLPNPFKKPDLSNPFQKPELPKPFEKPELPKPLENPVLSKQIVYSPRPKAFLPERKRLMPAGLNDKSKDEIYRSAWLEGWNAAQKQPVAPNLQVPSLPKRASLAQTIQQATGPAVPITTVLPAHAPTGLATPALAVAALPAVPAVPVPAVPVPAVPVTVAKLTSAELHSALLYWLDLLTDETKLGCMEVAKSIANDMNVKLAVMRERGHAVRDAMPFAQPPNTMDEFRAGLEKVPADELQAYLSEYNVVPKAGSDRKSLLEQLQQLEAMGSIDQFEANDRETKLTRPPGLA